ncbi:MAG: hypothetical protein SGPRY_004992 [Prymnesium sp.]
MPTPLPAIPVPPRLTLPTQPTPHLRAADWRQGGLQLHVQEVRSLFDKYGQLRHMLLAPANTRALVEFLEPADAAACEGKSIAPGEEEGDEAREEETEGCTLFADPAALRAHFERQFRLRSATVVTKPPPKKTSERAPVGYGLVEFRQPSDAREALLRLARSRLNSRKLKLSSRPCKPSHLKESAVASKGGGEEAYENSHDPEAAVRGLRTYEHCQRMNDF